MIDEPKLRACVAAAIECLRVTLEEMSGEPVDISDTKIEPNVVVEAVKEHLGDLDYFDLEVVRDQYDREFGEGTWGEWLDQII